MNYKNFVSVILILLTFGCSKNQKSESVENGRPFTDDLGEKIYFVENPKRIISLTPALTEMIYELKLDSFLVGNTTYCYYPEDAKNKTKTADLMNVNYEIVSQLNPDLIIVAKEGSTKSNYDRLKQMGFKIFVFDSPDFNGVKRTFIKLASIFGKEALADSITVLWDKRLKAIIKPGKKLTGLALISTFPIFAAGKNTFINEIFKINGVKNIAAEGNVNYPVYSREEILLKDPDFILFVHTEPIETIKKQYPEWKKLKAFRNGNIFFVDADIYSRPGPRIILAAEDLNEKLRNIR